MYWFIPEFFDYEMDNRHTKIPKNETPKKPE
jgi:hypothetical protein